MTRPSRKHWMYIIIGTVSLALILSIGLFVRLQSVSAVKHLVRNLSDGKYSFQASNVRVDPFHMIVRAKKIRIYPVNPGNSNTEFELSADSISLNLKEVFRLIFMKKLNVASFTIVKPALLLKVYEKRSGEDEPIIPLHEQVARVQTIFFDVLESLKVKSFKLIGGSVAYYPQQGTNDSRYLLNNIDLTITDLHLLKRISKWNKDNQVYIHFELRQPTIEYPDSSIVINLEKLVWDTKVRKFELSGLGFHKSFSSPGDSSGFRLEGIELDSLNWNKLLTEGVVELEMLKASKGIFNSNDFHFRKTRDSLKTKSQGNLLDVIGPILVKKLSIREIDFTGTTHTRRGKENVLISGDEFEVTNLIINKDLPHKIELDDLKLKVKAFIESDSSKTFQAGFDELLISKKNLVLRDYFLHTMKKTRLGENKIDVKELILVDLSIPDLINGKLKAKELILSDPILKLSLPPNKKRSAEIQWKKVRKDISRKLDIGLIRIMNANVSVTQYGKKMPLVNTDSFYAVIASKNLLASNSLEDIFEGENSLSMPRLLIQLPNMIIDCRNAVYDRKSLKATTATGHTTDGNLKFDFKNLYAHDINTAGIISGKDSTWLRMLDIGSGSVYVKIPDKKADSTGKKPHKNSDMVRTIHSGPVLFHLVGKDYTVRTSFDSISVGRLRQEKEYWVWDSLYITGKNLDIDHPKIKGNAASYAIGNNFSNSIHTSHWEFDNDKTNVLLNIPAIDINHKILNSNDLLSSVKQVTLIKPEINIILKKTNKSHEKKESSEPIELPAISLIDPMIRISREDENGLQKLASADGGNISVEQVQVKNGRIRTDAIEIDLKKIATHQDKFDLQIPSLELKTGKIDFHAGEPFQTIIHKLNMADARFTFNNNRVQLSANGITTHLEKSFRLNTSTDSLKKLLTSLPHLMLITEKLMFENSEKKLFVSQIKVQSENKQISFDSIRLVGTIPRDSFFVLAKVQKDFTQFSTGAGVLSGYEMIDRGFDTIWKIDQFKLSELNMLFERDKRFPVDSINYRPLLTGMLKNMPLLFSLDKILLENARIRYNEIGEKKGKEGSIWFGNINATIRNIRNFDIQKTDSLQLTANGKLMDQGNIRLSFRESYADSLQGFFLLARMGKMQLNALSPLLLPLFNLQVNKGLVDSVSLKVKANDYLAYGNMELKYNDLRLSLLNDSGKRQIFASWVINTFLKNKNDENGLIFRERLRNKSIFNYWGKIALSGLMTNMGIQKNKKASKKYYREMSNLNLPSTLLTE
jgi:hypothetical protein